jgi:tonB-linked outer membrane protein, susC/ragA family
MTLKFFILLLTFGTASAMGYAQEQKLNVAFHDEMLENVLEYLKKNTDYEFVYRKEILGNTKVKNVELKDVTLREVLDQVLRRNGFDYEIVDQVIVIRKLPTIQQKKEIKIAGQVTDEQKHPMPGVTVRVKGLTIGTATDRNGKYVLRLPEVKDLTLIFSFIGMESKEVKYTGQDTINVVLKEDVKAMEEVVVTGYQTLRKSDVVGSTTTVKASDIMMPAYASIDQMLQGRVAGMVVMNTSSRVGTSPKIRIRGTSTILGNQDPLWVVDGVIQPDPLPLNQNDMMMDDLKNILGNQISWLNPADIETITVLKDASATAIYGSKAANGVIVITTKRGQTDRMTVNYSGTFSFRARPHYGLFNLMNSAERIQFSREAFAAGAVYESAPVESLSTYEGIMTMFYNKQISKDEAEIAIQKLEGTNTDWFKLLTRNSFSHNHNVSISGGSEKVVYSASVGFSDQSGVEKNNDAKNLSGRLNLGIRLHPKVYLDMSLIGSINRTWGYAAGVDPLGYASSTSRSVLAYDDKGNRYFHELREKYDYNENHVFLGFNILNEMDHSYSKNKNSQISGNVNFSWDITPWLKYEFVGGINNSNGISESYAGEQTYYIAKKYRGYDFGTEVFGSDKYNAAMLPAGGELYNGHSDVLGWNVQNKITFQKSFDEDHRINVLIGTEVASTKTANKGQKIYGYVKERGESLVKPTPLEELVPIGSIPVVGWGILDNLYNGAGWSRSTLTDNKFSLFATLVYAYKNRYVLNASVRNDASNRFGQDQNKRFDPTYSFGVSWNVAQEPWLNSISNVLNQFNMRITYGIQGNAVNSISPELILNMGTTKPYYGDYMSTISRIPNPNLSWERTKTWNFGLDLQLIQWITMNLEYYTKRSNNIVNQRIALEYGREGTEVNGGRIENSGVEYSLNITPIRNKDWAWTIGLNSSKNWNKAKTRSISGITLRDYLSGATDRVLKEGYAVSSFWSFGFKGVNPNNGSPEFNLIYEQDEAGNYVRDEKTNELILREISDYTDLLVYSGKNEPDFTGGLTTRLRWKDLTFGANFSLLLGAKKRLPNPYSASGNIPLSGVNLSKDLLKRWKAPGDEKYTNIPGVYSGRVENLLTLQDEGRYNVYDMWGQSDIMVVNADFLRCQQMSLTWNMNEKWCARIGVKSLSLNAIINNVFVIADKKFHGFDPELGNSVQPKTYSVGVTVGF